MVNTTEKGDALRNSVFSLVKASNKLNCSIEKDILGKKADVYFEEPKTLGRKVTRYAVECKDYGKSLSREDFNKIFREYFPVKEVFDILLVISRSQPTSSVLSTIEHHDWMVHYSVDEFFAQLMNFELYLRSMLALFNNEGLSSYYVPVQDLYNGDLEERIALWVNSNNDRPQAILAGYGMGKTSFAKRLAYRYVEEFQKFQSTRIPVYLKLGDIFTEQSLEGLVCKHFAADYPVPGFNYQLFLEFNKQGRFIIILDGFDEMKHAMSYRSFEANIRELNQLVVSNSKIIILGRPNAFTSEDEKRSVLHGMMRIGQKEIKNLEMVDYEEIEVAMFTKPQLEQFIVGFLDYRRTQESISGTKYLTRQFCNDRADEILGKRFEDLIQRPVHARMLALIALGTEEPLADFSRYHLYEAFLKHLYQREHGKKARQGVCSDQRHEFIRLVAWTQWISNTPDSFSFENVSAINLPEYGDDSVSKESLLRELVIGSILEAKGDYYFFAHRSFQEFLVAEHISLLTSSPTNTIDIDRHLNPEVEQFINESGAGFDVALAVMNSLWNFSSPLKHSFICFIVDHLSSRQAEIYSDVPPSENPWAILLFVIMHQADLFNGDGVDELFKYYNALNKDEDILALIDGVLLLIAKSASDGIGDTLISGILCILYRQAKLMINKVKIHKNMITGAAINADDFTPWVMMLIDSIQVEFSDKGELKLIIFNLEKLMSLDTSDKLRRCKVTSIQGTLPNSVKIKPSSLQNNLVAQYMSEKRNEAIFKLEKNLKKDQNKAISKARADHLKTHEVATNLAREDVRKFTHFFRAEPKKSDFIPVAIKTLQKEKRNVLTLKK